MKNYTIHFWGKEVQFIHFANHAISPHSKSSLVLSESVELEDLPFADDVDIDVDDDAIFVQEDAFDDPDEEEYSRRMEYYDGAKASHLYRKKKKKNLFPTSLRQANDALSNSTLLTRSGRGY